MESTTITAVANTHKNGTVNGADGETLYYYVDASFPESDSPCRKGSGDLMYSGEDVAYQWNFLPVRPETRDSFDSSVMASCFLIPGNQPQSMFSTYLVAKRSPAHRIVKAALLLSSLCRCYSSCVKIYEAVCIFDYLLLMRNLPNDDGSYLCYAGYFFSPNYYLIKYDYIWSTSAKELCDTANTMWFGCITVSTITSMGTFWRLKLKTIKETNELEAKNDSLLVSALAFASLAFFTDFLVISITDDNWKLNTVIGNVANTFRNIIFICYGSVCRPPVPEKKVPVITVKAQSCDF
ncbi:unnamed protein product, partial [Mesorhabditis spiculigera]